MKSLLAGYISAASVDLARVRDHGGWVEVYDEASYESGNYPGLEVILDTYFRRSAGKVDIACFGVAGPVIRDEVSTTNLPWHIAGQDIEKRFSISRVCLINDIVATAYGLPLLASDKFYTLNKGVGGENGNIGLIAAGSGLGEALIYHTGDEINPYASEGGHADFAPGNQIEVELWEYLYSELGQVEAEDVISRRGLERIYNFLVDTHGGVRSDWFDQAKNRSMAVIEKALSGEDKTAARTLDIFIDCYASEAANLALKGMTLGGIYIGGLLAPQIITAFDQGKFMRRFVKRGKMEDLLSRMPVGVIIEPQTALLGAAGMSTKL